MIEAEEELSPEQLDRFKIVAEAVMNLLRNAEQAGVPCGVLVAGTLSSVARFFCGHIDPRATEDESKRIVTTFEGLVSVHWADWVQLCHECEKLDPEAHIPLN